MSAKVITPPTKELSIKCSNDAALHFVATYNAFVRTIEKDPLGPGKKLEVGEWYFCPNSRNIFSFKELKGGFKDGTVIFDMDIGDSTLETPRASYGEDYHYKKTKQEEMYQVDQSKFEKQLDLELKGGKVHEPFRKRFRHIFNAVYYSGLTNQKLKEKANKEFLEPGMNSKEDLVNAFLITCAKRHTNNEDYRDMSCIEKYGGSQVKESLAKDMRNCQKDWIGLIDLYCNANKTPIKASPTGAAEFPSTNSGARQRRSEQKYPDKKSSRAEKGVGKKIASGLLPRKINFDAVAADYGIKETVTQKNESSFDATIVMFVLLGLCFILSRYFV